MLWSIKNKSKLHYFHYYVLI
jgi:hypothetical protein